jgi:CheY-like chemotaxis protein
LIVEDDPAIRRLLEALLASAGHQVLAAPDGPRALELAAQHHPRAVFLDLTLPEMSGWEVLRYLRTSATPPLVIILTADADAARRAIREGAYATILKPFDIDEVLDLAARLPTDTD